MRILIVDGFGNSKQGREGMRDFEFAIRKSLEGPYYKYLTDV